jgi:hypothetical protein
MNTCAGVSESLRCRLTYHYLGMRRPAVPVRALRNHRCDMFYPVTISFGRAAAGTGP